MLLHLNKKQKYIVVHLQELAKHLEEGRVIEIWMYKDLA